MNEMTSRDMVLKTLNGANSGRAPRQLWALPWAGIHHHDTLVKIMNDFPADIVTVGAALKEVPSVTGVPFEAGEYIDEFGCVFQNIQRGVIGEVKRPIVTDDGWADADNVHIPEEWLTFDTADANENIRKTGGKFTIAGCTARPFEQLQFIRGSENLYVDLMYKPSGMMAFIEKLHDFYCRLLTKWAQTEADALMFMDDWGSQKTLLISPALWDGMFRPMYQDYIDIAHQAGKKAFMHSDGYTLDIIPRLVDMGLDALNTQIFCMGIDVLKQFKGKLTFWGEIDRQHLLPYGSKEDIRRAVTSVYSALYDNGYAIAQCEFGAGAKPENIAEVFKTWDLLTNKC
ncbi:MAG: methyltransferase [Firmicutes bacterium]|nr:methyltransferase [Bacillota bacterium]